MRGRLVTSLVSGLALSLFLSVSLNAEDLPRRMASLGDSMTEGMLADLSYENGISAWQLVEMLQFAAITNPERRMEALRKRYAAVHKSWAVGNDLGDLVWSQYERLQAHQPNLEAYNFAISGSESKDVVKQAERLVEFQEKEGVPFDYVTILVGANDLGKLNVDEVTSAQDYLARMEEILKTLLSSNPKMKILILGLPDIFRVFDETESLVVRQLLGQKWKCGEVRRMIYGNYPAFADPSSAERQLVEKIVEQYRQVTLRLVERMKKTFPSAGIKTIQYIPNKTEARKLIAVDCFHPSEWGQAALAEISWKAGFWPHLEVPKF